MSTPEEIQDDIEQTRADVRQDVEALQEKVNPEVLPVVARRGSRKRCQR